MPNQPTTFSLSPSVDQVSGSLDRILWTALGSLATWLVTKGYLSASDAALLVPVAVALVSGIYGLWTNRQKALVQSAANVPGTIVVTSNDLAVATPGQQNIVSNTKVEVKDMVTNKKVMP